MSSLFIEQPLLLQAFPALDRGVLLGINRIGQVLVVSGAVMGVYHESLARLLPRWLQISASLIRRVAAGTGWRWAEGDVGFEFPPEIPPTHAKFLEDVEIGKQLLLSAIVLGLLLWSSGRGPFGWLAFPFEVALGGITSWSDIEWTFSTVMKTVGSSALRLFSFPPLLFLAILLCAIVARPYAFVLSRVADRVSPGHINAAISTVLAIGSLLILIAT